MKRILISIIITVSIFIDAQAQKNAYQAGFKVSYPDLSAKSFFDKHPNFDRIIISYKNDTAVTVNLYSDPTNDWNPNEKYELSFEGDRYLLAKKYEMLVVTKPPKLTMQYFEGIPKQSQTGYGVQTTLRSDSIIHRFSFFTITGNDEHTKPIFPYRTKFKGDFLALQKKLELNFKQWKPIPVLDSVLIITGIVDRDGSFGNLGLKTGNPSQFSKRVMEFIEREATAWYPAWSDTRSVKYLVKFFIRLNADESITFSVL